MGRVGEGSMVMSMMVVFDSNFIVREGGVEGCGRFEGRFGRGWGRGLMDMDGNQEWGSEIKGRMDMEERIE